MICGGCGQSGHNNTSKNCPRNIVTNNFSKMYKLTHTGSYYLISQDFIQKEYPGKICVSSDVIRWNRDSKSLSNITQVFGEKTSCNSDYIYFKLNLSGNNYSHANYILLHIKRNIFWRYEPHGSYDSDPNLDKALFDYAGKNGYMYLAPIISCPAAGIQKVALDKIGLCQTSVMYSLLNNLDPRKYNYNHAIINNVSAMRELERLAITFLTNIYIKSSEGMRILLLDYNNLNEFQKSTVIYDLSKLI
jgi:hypothetical protein